MTTSYQIYFYRTKQVLQSLAVDVTAGSAFRSASCHWMERNWRLLSFAASTVPGTVRYSTKQSSSILQTTRNYDQRPGGADQK